MCTPALVCETMYTHQWENPPLHIWRSSQKFIKILKLFQVIELYQDIERYVSYLLWFPCSSHSVCMGSSNLFFSFPDYVETIALKWGWGKGLEDRISSDSWFSWGGQRKVGRVAGGCTLEAGWVSRVCAPSQGVARPGAASSARGQASQGTWPGWVLAPPPSACVLLWASVSSCT